MSKSSADGVVWNLNDLYASRKDPKIEQDLSLAKQKAVDFEKRYKENLIQLASDGRPTRAARRSHKGQHPRCRNTSIDMILLVKDYAEIVALMTRPSVFAMLSFASDTKNPENGSFLQKVQNRCTEIRAHYLFWELIWSRLDGKRAGKILAKPELAPHRHLLSHLRDYAPFLLQENEEKIVDIMDNTGARAFQRLFDEVINGIVFLVRVNGKLEEKTESEVLALLHSPDRQVRKNGQESLTEGLKKNAHVLTYIFNMILAAHKDACKIRRYQHPMEIRNLANETTLPVVENLIRSVKAAYPIVARYYKLKRKLLDLETLYDYDRYAPVSDRVPKCTYAECKEKVRSAYQAFDPEVGRIVDQFFDKNWIDAELRPGKQGGAFSAGTTPDLHPYVLVNYNDRLRDVMVVAHELGHGVHQYLSRTVGILECHAPLTLAECASVFGEMIVFERLMKEESDNEVKLSLLCGKIEDVFATVFRQMVMTDFELKIHFSYLKDGELTTERFGDFWMEANRPMHGESVMLTEGYRFWWMYIPHMIHTPFYCYSYAFAQLLVLSLYEKYKKAPKRFVPNYLKLLALGGSQKPEELCKIVSLDIQNPSFWKSGLALIDRMIGEAEELVGTLHD